LPTNRGFDTFYGYYTGAEDYYQHTRMPDTKPHTPGYDFRDQDEVASEARGSYSAHLFGDRVVDIIKEQANSLHPMFLYLPFQSVHAPLQVPEEYENHFSHITNKARRTYSGMVMAMDEAVGNITTALEEAGMMDNTLILFTADNGGQTMNGGNNFPLRGNKGTLWEGGTRAASFVYGSMLARRGSVSRQVVHVTDWLPTLVTAAGGDPAVVEGLDGVDQWAALTGHTQHPRTQMLYNIDPLHNAKNESNGAVRLGPFKLIRGDPGKPDGWIPPAEVSDQGEEEAEEAFKGTDTRSDQLLLFNLDFDPDEKTNLVSDYPAITDYLCKLLDQYQAGMVEPDIAAEVQEGNPSNYDGVWSTGWCDV